jgi:hypothetical protein
MNLEIDEIIIKEKITEEENTIVVNVENGRYSNWVYFYIEEGLAKFEKVDFDEDFDISVRIINKAIEGLFEEAEKSQLYSDVEDIESLVTRLK